MHLNQFGPNNPVETTELAASALISFFSVFYSVNKDFLFFIIDSIYDPIVP